MTLANLITAAVRNPLAWHYIGHTAVWTEGHGYRVTHTIAGGAGVGVCRACSRLVVRGLGRWWE